MTIRPETDNTSPPLEVVMTLGPSSSKDELILGLMGVATRFRLNASHLDLPALTGWLERLDALFARRGEHRPVVIDLQGAKMRLGKMEPVEPLPPEVWLVCAEELERTDLMDALPVPHPELFEAVRIGERLLLDDARIELEVLQREDRRLRARVVRGGSIKPRKGINQAEHPIPYRRLREEDRAVIQEARRFSFCQLAFSFVLDGGEASLLREITDQHLVAKLERPEALEHVEAIAASFDELWLCRGDIGSQAGLARLGPLQRRFTQQLAGLSVPALLAGQVLEHMTAHALPTRSEVVHLYDVSLAGWAGVVLSDETAIGDDPLAVARLLESLPFIARPAASS